MMTKEERDAALARPLIPVRTAGAVLGLSHMTATKAVKAGDIPTVKVGARLLVPTAALRAMIGLPAAAA